VEQRSGNAEASADGLLFQGLVSGPLHIHRETTFAYASGRERLMAAADETRREEYVVQRIIPFPRNEDVVNRDIFAALDRLLPPSRDSQSAALWGLGGSGYVCCQDESLLGRVDIADSEKQNAGRARVCVPPQP
jgi:hypothetical protein